MATVAPMVLTTPDNLRAPDPTLVLPPIAALVQGCRMSYSGHDHRPLASKDHTLKAASLRLQQVQSEPIDHQEHSTRGYALNARHGRGYSDDTIRSRQKERSVLKLGAPAAIYPDTKPTSYGRPPTTKSSRGRGETRHSTALPTTSCRFGQNQFHKLDSYLLHPSPDKKRRANSLHKHPKTAASSLRSQALALLKPDSTSDGTIISNLRC